MHANPPSKLPPPSPRVLYMSSRYLLLTVGSRDSSQTEKEIEFFANLQNVHLFLLKEPLGCLFFE